MCRRTTYYETLCVSKEKTVPPQSAHQQSILTPVLAATPNRFFKHLALYNAVAGTEDVVTHVEPVASVPGLSRFILAAANADPTSLFRRTARYLSTRGVNIQRAYLEAMGPAEGPTVSIAPTRN